MGGSGNHETGPESVPWRSGPLYVILSSSLMGVMGITLVSPVLPAIQGLFSVSDAQVGLVMTAYTLPGIGLTPFVGLVADRIGRRRVLIPLLFLYGVAGVGVSFAGNFPQIVALRFLQGVGGSALVALAITLIGDLYDARLTNRIVGINSSTLAIGAAFYPLIGGTLAAIRWNAPFLFFGVSLLVGLFATAVLPEPDIEKSTDVRTYLGDLKRVLLLPRALAIFAVLVLFIFVFFGGVLTALPLLLDARFGMAADRIGLILSISAVTTAAVSTQYGRIAEWRSVPQLIALGVSLFGVGFLGLRLAPDPVTVAIVMPLFGTGIGLVMPTVDQALIGIGPGRLRAGVLGIRTGMLRVGQTLGPVGFPAIAISLFPSAVEGYGMLLIVVGCGMVLFGAVGYILFRHGSLGGFQGVSGG